MKGLRVLLFIVICSMCFGVSLVSAQEKEILSGGLLVDNKTMLPMRSLFETLGATVTWNGENQSIIARKGEKTLILYVNDKEININGEVLKLEVPPRIIEGNTMVPVRLVANTLDADVTWDGAKKQAAIRTENQMVVFDVNRYIEDVAITISAAGDVTLGRDENYGYYGSFDEEAKKHGNAYFVKNIKKLFSQDDLTMVNLETTLTDATVKADKKFRFKGDPSYTEVLTLGSIDAVNLANNHTYDYLQKGYQDTVQHLENAGIGYFGYNSKYVKEIKGIKVGALGYKGWTNSSGLQNKIKQDIQSLRKQGVQVVIVQFHWGQERAYVPNYTQKALGRHAIDSGADLVLGHHPHVVQGIEEYKDKFIVYSLGNFMFGGNKNPSDKDTFVFQQTFHLKNDKMTDKKEINVIPFSISSVSHRNNYQPTPMSTAEASKLKQKLITLSEKINNANWVLYENKAITYDNAK